MNNFDVLARAALGPYLDKIGLVIYSSASTLAGKNDVVFWGFNPGQGPKVSDPTHWTIRDALDRFPTQTGSLLWQVWPRAGGGTHENNGARVFTHHYDAGAAPYQ